MSTAIPLLPTNPDPSNGRAWSQPITWGFSASNLSNQPADSTFSAFISSSNYRELITKAVALWASIANLTFEFVPDDSSTLDIRVGFETLTSLDEIGSTSSRPTFRPGGVTVGLEDPSERALTPLPDGDYVYAGTLANPLEDVTDLFQDAVHEIGHAIGLDHNEADNYAVMYPSIGPDNRSTNVDDALGVENIYGGSYGSLAQISISNTGPDHQSVKPYQQYSPFAHLAVQDGASLYEKVTVTVHGGGSLADRTAGTDASFDTSTGTFTESGVNLTGGDYAQAILNRLVYEAPSSFSTVGFSVEVDNSLQGTASYNTVSAGLPPPPSPAPDIGKQGMNYDGSGNPISTQFDQQYAGGGTSALAFSSGGSLVASNFIDANGALYNGVLATTNTVNVPADGRAYFLDSRDPYTYTYLNAADVHLTYDIFDPVTNHLVASPGGLAFAGAISVEDTDPTPFSSPIYGLGTEQIATVVNGETDSSGNLVSAADGSGYVATSLSFVQVNKYNNLFGNLDFITYNTLKTMALGQSLQDPVIGLYQEVLGRAADPAGLANWDTALAQPGGSISAVQSGLAYSSEAAADINGLYQQVLGRTADDAGVAAWQAVLAQPGNSMSSVRLGIANSAEAATDIGKIYQQALGRTVDPGGLASWQDDLAQPGGSLSDVRAGAADSPEAADNIDATYGQILGRSADAGGVADWQAKLAQPGWSLLDVRAGIAGSAEAADDINSIYQQVLGRSVDPAGEAHWQAALTQAGGSLNGVRTAIIASAEATTDIDQAFSSAYNRVPSSSELASATTQLVDQVSLSQLTQQLANSRNIQTMMFLAGGITVTASPTEEFHDAITQLGHSAIIDFNPSTSIFDVDKSLNFSTVLQDEAVTGAGVQVNFDPNNSVTFLGLKPADLSAANFKFV